MVTAVAVRYVKVFPDSRIISIEISRQTIPANMDHLLGRPEQVQTMPRQPRIVIAELENA